VDRAIEHYPVYTSESDVYLCLSHKKRILMNEVVNKREAAKQSETLFLARPDAKSLFGVTLEPQDMKIWRGIQLIGSDRASRVNGVVNGIVYIVEAFDALTVTVVRHADYTTKAVIVADPGAVKLVDEVTRDPTKEPEPDNDEDDDAAAATPGNSRLVLSHDDVALKLRLQHAMCYASVQGRTLRDVHVTLLDVRRPLFTLRHLIVGLSRVTSGAFMHILPKEHSLGKRATPAECHNIHPVTGQSVQADWSVKMDYYADDDEF
jgi:hypothetical protein